mgnify:CR=1 FL=1
MATLSAAMDMVVPSVRLVTTWLLMAMVPAAASTVAVILPPERQKFDTVTMSEPSVVVMTAVEPPDRLRSYIGYWLIHWPARSAGEVMAPRGCCAGLREAAAFRGPREAVMGTLPRVKACDVAEDACRSGLAAGVAAARLCSSGAVSEVLERNPTSCVTCP